MGRSFVPGPRMLVLLYSGRFLGLLVLYLRRNLGGLTLRRTAVDLKSEHSGHDLKTEGPDILLFTTTNFDDVNTTKQLPSLHFDYVTTILYKSKSFVCGNRLI